MTERDKFKRRYREFFLKRHNLLCRCNMTGKWSIQDWEKYHRWRVKLDGMAWLLELSAEELQELERTETKQKQSQPAEKIGS